MAVDTSGPPAGGAAGSQGSASFMHPAARALSVFDQAPAGLAVVDGRGRLEAVNPRWCSLLGCSREALLGRTLQDVLPVPMEEAPGADGEEAGPFWCRLAPGVVADSGLLLSHHPLGERGHRLLILFAEDELSDVARQDPLTGLASTVAFQDRLTHAIERADRLEQPLALLVIQLDGYRDLARQDRALAWRLLRQVSRRMAQTFRAEDSLGALGEGRWVVLIEHPVTPERLQVVVLRFQEAMEAPFELTPRPLLLTASVGIACYPEDAEDGEALFAGAEGALERTLAEGPGGYAFQRRQLHHRLDRRAEFRARLQEALFDPGHHFQLRFQPLVAPEAGHCLALETLIRWQHPHRGALQPRDFLPLVAEMGESVRLDRWVLERIIRQRRDWVAAGSPLGRLDVSVNLAVASLDQRVFDGRPLDHFLRQQEVDLDWLLLEIDAGQLMAQGGEHLHLLKRLRRLGVRLVADELDRAPLLMEALAALPLGHAKIGRRLVSSLGRKPAADRAFGALLSVLEALGIEGMLVGVETREQRREGSRPGIVMLQGNLIAPPLEAPALAEWLRRHGGEPG